MKKLFISVPMKGRTEENIRKSLEKMHKLAEIIFDEKLEVIPSYVEHKPPEDSKEAIWYLSRSIEKLAKADYFIGIKYSSYKGCNIENQIASDYGLKTYYCDIDIFPDVLKNEMKVCGVNIHEV